MGDYLVVVTDHDFDDLSIERDVLDGIAEVQPLAEDVGDVTRDLPAGTDGILTLRAELDRSTITDLDACRIIARYGIGVDNVNVDAAGERGIYVTNVPEYCLEEVATHALGMAISLTRSLPQYDRSVAAGEWDRDVGAPVRRFSTQTVGVVGFGAIGRAFGERAAALGADIVASDPYVDDDAVVEYDVELLEFEELLEHADVVSVHSPLTDSTRGMFDEEAFDRMRDSAYLINASRGPIVDRAALVDALDAGEISGAGLDVFPEEPPAVDDPLRDHDAVLSTPHVGWYSEEANAERRRTAARCVRRALEGQRPPNLVNEDALGG
ncbi:C-terminal binding protein [Natrialbaceae archaeon AArc-T1-2]|uniref:C-terminal binding protein n=1 Tax=Natrialbaceae archaeon AArc-T1-2 TaxID=3053904 RepID=UPI00255B2EDC|nr:C-terminal binding protein [Natrialbaceae archaeon AArc-T1-2]WIV67025.1 C-terminal binding protein [Natrialbaceae archaeon AArc-T1-2]